MESLNNINLDTYLENVLSSLCSLFCPAKKLRCFSCWSSVSFVIFSRKKLPRCSRVLSPVWAVWKKFSWRLLLRLRFFGKPSVLNPSFGANNTLEVDVSAFKELFCGESASNADEAVRNKVEKNMKDIMTLIFCSFSKDLCRIVLRSWVIFMEIIYFICRRWNYTSCSLFVRRFCKECTFRIN